MQIGDARQTLLEIDRVRRDTRRDLHPTWFVNVVIGVFFAGATLLALAAPDAPLINTLYWAIGIPAGLALIVRHEARREREVGAEAPLADPALLVFGLIVAACIAINTLSDSDAAWGYAVAAGWLAIAALYRDVLMATIGVALAAVTTGVIAAGPADAWAWVQLPMAAMLIAAGLIARAWERA